MKSHWAAERWSLPPVSQDRKSHQSLVMHKTEQELCDHTQHMHSAEHTVFLLGVRRHPEPWKSGCCGCEDPGMETL